MTVGNRFRHGAVAIAVTAAVIAAVIFLNVGFTALFSGNLIFGDLTSEQIYTLNEETTFLLDQTFDSVSASREAAGEDPVRVDIIFCADRDLLVKSNLMRYVYYTARSLEKKYPDIIRVKTVDVWSNPSAVDAYRTNSYSSIYQSNVIIASGSEFRVLSLRGFFTYDTETDEEPWAYSGERIFTRAIMVVTKAEAPICGVTINHGEALTAESEARYSGLLNTLRDGGYKIQYLNLAEETIPEDCRMILVFDPQSDFTSGSYLSGETGEIGKLEAFLENANSLMVFVDADTPSLPNFEEFLEDWGIAFERYIDPADQLTVLGNYQVISPKDSIDTESKALIATYETAGSGGSVTESMREAGVAPKVIFPNVMPITYSSSYEQVYYLDTEDDSTTNDPYTYGFYYSNGHSRSIYDLFRSSSAARGTYAVAQNQGVALLDAGGNPVTDGTGNFKLATITSESRTVGEGRGYTTVNNASYVCAFGSTGFADNQLLLSASYGNTDVLLQILRSVGREVIGVGLNFEPMYDDAIGDDAVSEQAKVAWTVVLALIPAVVITGLGVWVLVRRRFSR